MPSEMKYPLGARWEAVDGTGRVATVWFDARMCQTEIWRWRVTYGDGSPAKHDWWNTRQKCIEAAQREMLGSTIPQLSIQFRRLN